jgi:hypothetical protein
MAEITVTGENCREIAEHLSGWQELNREVESLCGDLAERMYPEDKTEETHQHSETREAGE